MQNGICPECGGTEVYMKRGAVWGHLTGIFVKLGGLWKGKGITLDALICVRCGHTAFRVPASSMDQLRAALAEDGWTRVEGSAYRK
jgi:hypothetical protein